MDGKQKTIGRKVSLRVFRPGEKVEVERADAAYWFSLTPAERVELAWQLSEEQWALMEAAGKIRR
jgi:hypothetical protein